MFFPGLDVFSIVFSILIFNPNNFQTSLCNLIFMLYNLTHNQIGFVKVFERNVIEWFI